MTLARLLHIHFWRRSAWCERSDLRPFVVDAEQTCRCGAKRHRDLSIDNVLTGTEGATWIPGPHPSSPPIRALDRGPRLLFVEPPARKVYAFSSPEARATRRPPAPPDTTSWGDNFGPCPPAADDDTPDSGGTG